MTNNKLNVKVIRGKFWIMLSVRGLKVSDSFFYGHYPESLVVITVFRESNESRTPLQWSVLHIQHEAQFASDRHVVVEVPLLVISSVSRPHDYLSKFAGSRNI